MGSVHAYTNAQGDKLYRIAYRRPDNTQTNERGFTRKRDAEARLAQVEVSKHRGEYVNPTDANVTIDDLGAQWLDAHDAAVKPSTHTSVETSWRIHVRPKWGKRKVGSIRHTEVAAWVAKLSKERSATIVKRAHGVLASILDGAVKDRRITTNPARDVKTPRKGSKPRVYLSHVQVERVAAASKYPELLRFLAYTGLRWGEATGLRVKHVDRERRRANIVENAVNVGGTVIVGTPKTHEQRSVPYPSFLDADLERMSKGKSPASLIWAGRGGAHLGPGNAASGWFERAVQQVIAEDIEAAAKAKARGEVEPPVMPRVTPHDLRHTAASLAISAGANVKAVQRMLGHASAAMTLDTYADLFDDDLDGVAVALDHARRAAVVVNLLSRGEN
ncbi:tyrosine-type recombinase/integrase [Leucobacter sp. HY1910]